MSSELDVIISKINSLAPLPDVVQRVLFLVNKSDSTVDELAETIAVDQALTARLLKYCNSAFFGYPRKISTLHKAIITLGFKVIKNMVLTGYMNNFLKGKFEAYSYSEGELVRHSIVSACSAQLLARYAAPELIDTAYTAGLLHDIGKVVMEQFVGEKFDEIITVMKEKQLPFNVVEKQVIGYSHAEIGAVIAEKWNYPVELVEAIKLHHSPAQATHNPTLCTFVNLGDSICRMLGVGVGLEGVPEQLNQEVLKVVSINDNNVESVKLEIKDFMGELNLFFDS